MLSGMSGTDAIRLGVAGLGGYAGEITNAILELGGGLSPSLSLTAVADPRPDLHSERAAMLLSKGVRVHDDFGAMLKSGGLDALWLPVPIPLHRPFLEQGVARGLPVMVEKPAAATVQDVDAMIRARDEAGVPVAVGFQDVYDPQSLSMKHRILSGEFGALRSATLQALWPRNAAYFARARWAGAIQLDGAWVLDSPAHNALSHFINIGLFLLGPDTLTSAAPLTLEAELYRAADIENYDTCSFRLTLPSPTGDAFPFLVLMSHASSVHRDPEMVMRFEKGTVVRSIHGYRIETSQGELETISHEGRTRRHILERFARLVRGVSDPSRAYSTLESARVLTLVINAASQATPVWPVAPEHVEVATHSQGGDVQAVRGIAEVFEHCAAREQMLHESGLLAFTRPAGRFNGLAAYNAFNGIAQASSSSPSHL